MATRKRTRKEQSKSSKPDKVHQYTFTVEMEVTAFATSEDIARTMVEDCVLAGQNGCDAGILQATLVETVY